MAVPDPAPDSGAGSPDSTDPPRVLVDVMCGTLATYLRMCGYDAAYALDEGIEADDALAALSAAEDRLLLTRDRELAARVDDALCLTERDVLDQLSEIVAAGYPVEIAAEPTRCGAFDLLPRLQLWDSPMGILRLRVSLAAQIRFRVASVAGRRPITTESVLFSACSGVKATFPPARGRRPRSGRHGLQRAGPHGSRHPKCYAVHGSPSR